MTVNPLTDTSRWTSTPDPETARKIVADLHSSVPPVIPPPELQFPAPEPVAPWTALALAMLRAKLAELAPDNPFDPAAWFGTA